MRPRMCMPVPGLEFFLHQVFKKDMQAHSMHLLVGKIPYEVSVTPFTFNTETRFRVSYNGSPEFIFTWDSELGRLAAIDHDAAEIPDDVEIAIAEQLQAGRY